MRVAVVTVVRGRARHLERQAAAVARLRPAPCAYVVVDMDPAPRCVPGATVVSLPVADGAPLPLARARNTAIAATDADLVVALDADCLPSPGLLDELARAARATGGASLLAGPVGRLPILAPDQADPTPAQLATARRAATIGDRPVPTPGAIVCEPRHELFWSLAFAVTPGTHARIGGFFEGYVGYGAEDTDYAVSARAAGVGLHWVGGAWAYHQGHPVSSPPVEHLTDIVGNARTFRARWGRWPMEGWLAAFAADGRIAWDPAGDQLAIAARSEPARAAA